MAGDNTSTGTQQGAPQKKNGSPTTFNADNVLALAKPKFVMAPWLRIAFGGLLIVTIPLVIAIALGSVRVRASEATQSAPSVANAGPTPTPDPNDPGDNKVPGVPAGSPGVEPTSTPLTYATPVVSAAPENPYITPPQATISFTPIPSTAPATPAASVAVPSISAGGTSATFTGWTGGDAANAQLTSAASPQNESRAEQRDDALTTNPHSVVPLRDPYTIFQGTYIPSRFHGKITSDFCSHPVAYVASDMYDSVDEEYLLIPAGTREMLSCHAGSVFGQNRIVVTLDRFIFPNGDSLLVDSFGATDSQGAAGVNADVDQHWGNLLGPTLVAALLQAGLQISTGGSQTTAVGGGLAVSQTPSQIAAQSIEQQLLQMGISVNQRSLAQMPTLSVNGGEDFNVEVLGDMHFRGPYQPEGVQR